MLKIAKLTKIIVVVSPPKTGKTQLRYLEFTISRQIQILKLLKLFGILANISKIKNFNILKQLT